MKQFEIIRTLVVDDSSFMRNSLSHILESDSSIEVVGTACDGAEAVKKVKQLRPDVVLLDIEMPLMDGLSALAYIMSECPTPTLMISALNQKEATIAIKSLESGAVDFIEKPSGRISYDIDKLSSEIIAKVKIAGGVNVRKINLRLPKKTFRRKGLKIEKRKEIVVIGASTGGPRAVAMVLSCLPGDFSASIIVVQHMGSEFVPSFTERLQRVCSLKVSTAQEGEVIRSGRVLVHPGNYRILVAQTEDTKKIHFSSKLKSHVVLASIDDVMESAAGVYAEKTLGVLLTGVGNDGVKGMKAIKAAGGSTIAEDQSTAIVFGMPKAAIEFGCVDEIIPLPEIAQAILRKT